MIYAFRVVNVKFEKKELTVVIPFEKIQMTGNPQWNEATLKNKETVFVIYV